MKGPQVRRAPRRAEVLTPRPRRLGWESLEARQLLSANPWDVSDNPWVLSAGPWARSSTRFAAVPPVLGGQSVAGTPASSSSAVAAPSTPLAPTGPAATQVVAAGLPPVGPPTTAAFVSPAIGPLAPAIVSPAAAPPSSGPDSSPGWFLVTLAGPWTRGSTSANSTSTLAASGQWVLAANWTDAVYKSIRGAATNQTTNVVCNFVNPSSAKPQDHADAFQVVSDVDLKDDHGGFLVLLDKGIRFEDWIGHPNPDYNDDYLKLTVQKRINAGLDVDNTGSIDGLSDPNNIQPDGGVKPVDYLPGYDLNGVQRVSTNSSYDNQTYMGQRMRFIVNAGTVYATSIKFELTKVTHIAGYAGNATDLDPTTGSDNLSGNNADDFSFLQNANTPAGGEVVSSTHPVIYASPTSRTLIASMEKNITWIDLWCKDYGGEATVKVTIYGRDGQTSTIQLGVPVDSKGDGIADKWKLEQNQAWIDQFTPYTSLDHKDLNFFSPGGLGDDAQPRLPGGYRAEPYDTQPNVIPGTKRLSGTISNVVIQHQDTGDGRDIFSDYRGYILDGGGSDWTGENGVAGIRGGHVRLSPVYKNLLVDVNRMSGVSFADALEWVDATSRHMGAAVDGAGVRMYYVLRSGTIPYKKFAGREDSTTTTAGEEINKYIDLYKNYFILGFKHLVLADHDSSWSLNDQQNGQSGGNLIDPQTGLLSGTDLPEWSVVWAGTVMAKAKLLLFPSTDTAVESTITHELAHLMTQVVGGRGSTHLSGPPYDVSTSANGNGVIDSDDRYRVLWDYNFYVNRENPTIPKSRQIAKLAVPLTPGAGSISLVPGFFTNHNAPGQPPFTSIFPDGVVQIGDEWIKYGAVTGSTLTVVNRGYYATPAAAATYPAGTLVTFVEPRLYWTRIQWGSGATARINRSGLQPTKSGVMFSPQRPVLPE